MEFLADPQIWISLLTLTALEIVLGIDNIIFISILAGKLPKEKQKKARQTGLGLALITRLLLLAGIAWMAKLTTPLFHILEFAISGRDLILLGGGLFLIAKSTYEIHEKLEGAGEHAVASRAVSFAKVIVQIILLDIVFSLDSVITAIGMANQLWVMVTAVIIALGIMLAFAGVISDFVERHPTLKMLALSFLILIGVSLMAEGLHQHISKGYIYFAMAFSCAVEFINLKLRARAAARAH
ncbi:MAG: TerC family protein [Opitutaceae bacterium]|nr:TerC family protein [Opitutaceae bacterium]